MTAQPLTRRQAEKRESTVPQSDPTNLDVKTPSKLMPRSSLLRFGLNFSIAVHCTASGGSQQLRSVASRSYAQPLRLRAFSSSPVSHKFKLQLSKRQQQPTMAPGMTTLKGQPLDRSALESLMKRRFFYAPTAEIYGYNTTLPNRGRHKLILLVVWLVSTTLDRLAARYKPTLSRRGAGTLCSKRTCWKWTLP